MKRSKAHQSAVDVLQHEQREKLAYHHALVAKLNGTIEHVGSVTMEGESYSWMIAFTPRVRDAVIVQTFAYWDDTSKSTKTNVRVFWLDDIARSWTIGSSYCDMVSNMYATATRRQQQEWTIYTETELATVA